MKWEILKGSEKDFDGAPEWATLLTKMGGHKFFVETHAVSARAIDIDVREEFKIDANPMPNQFDNIKIIAQRRPITEPDVTQQVTTEWPGEGLPPVGVRCEMLWDNEWVKCVVKAYGDEQFIFKADGHKEWSGHITNFSFRSICSHEDVAKDEAVKAMCAHWNLRTDFMCESIYDAIAVGKIPGVKLGGVK